MSDGNNVLSLDVNDLSEASTGEKRKREVKLRSKAWEHFTKLIKEDGTYEKCQCNHCNKLFTCSSRSGTTHLLRHITEGICPVYKKEKKDRPQSLLNYMRGSSEPRSSMASWKFNQGVDQSGHETVDMRDELLPVGLDDLERQTREVLEDDYVSQASPLAVSGKFPQQPALKSQSRGESWMNELRASVSKLVDLTNERLPKGSSIKNCLAVIVPDYSIAAAVRCLNEMEDIPQSSEMYLDAFEVLKDDGERECFICLPPEPRRRWLQRMLHRHYPLRYNCNF
ncbi:hypothetical protein ACH5RR_037589 [Cinchona calisaya]|uniref:BED-type domain-containing protein n=1 Tax=Cinchona calisaya TaxID=153742 RepID=A0ABD2YBD1_9GENT